MPRYGSLRDSECLDKAFSIDAPLNDRLANRAIAQCFLPNTKQYISAVGAAPNYINPVALSEKMQCRKLFDHNPLFNIFCDKLKAREYAQKLDSRLKCPEIYWSGVDPKEIPFDELAPPYIIKPNHRSGAIIPVRGAQDVDRRSILQECASWISEPYGKKTGEWGYFDVEPKIIVEQFLSAPEGSIYPDSLRLLTLSGKVALVYHDVVSNYWDGFTTCFDREWNRLPYCIWEGHWTPNPHLPNLEQVERPENLETIVEIAEKLASEVDQLRVDLYVTGPEIYFGELTAYDESGFAYPFPEKVEYDGYPPRDFDYHFGALWQFENKPVSEKLAIARQMSQNDDTNEATFLMRRLEIDAEYESRLDRAMSISPNMPEVLFQKSILESNRGAYDLAKASIGRAISLVGADERHVEQQVGILLEAGELERARAVVDAAVETNSNSPGLRYRKARVAQMQQDWDTAVHATNEAIELEPRNRTYHLLRFTLLGELKRHDELEVVLARAIVEFPGDGPFHHRLAVLRESLGRLDQALEDARTALKLQPEWVDAKILCANLLLKKSESLAEEGRPEQALACAREALNTSRHSGRLWENLADLQLAAGDPESARLTLQQGLRAFPSWASFYYRLSKIEQMGGDLDHALASIGKAIKLASDQGYFHMHKFGLLMEAGDDGGLLDAFDEALTYLPDHGGIHYKIAEFHKKAGRMENAREHSEKAVIKDPLLPHVVALHASILIDMEESERAQKALETMLAHSDDHPDVRHQMARVSAGRGDHQEAIANASRAVELRPDNAYYRQSLAEKQLAAGRDLDAENSIRKALEVFPENAQLRYLLGQALFNAGHLDEAIAEMQMAVKITPNSHHIRQRVEFLRQLRQET